MTRKKLKKSRNKKSSRKKSRKTKKITVSNTRLIKPRSNFEDLPIDVLKLMQTRALAFTNKSYSKTLPLNKEFYEINLIVRSRDGISQKEFTNMIKIRPNLLYITINMHNILITEIPIISSLKNLQYLSFIYTSITEIPNILINLWYLDCSYTPITKIPDTLVKLKNLYCRHTSIKEIPATLINLKYLYCNNTPITEIPDTLINLEYLNCKTTFVKNIPNTLGKLEILTCNRTVNIPKNLQERYHKRQIQIDITPD